MPLLMSFRYFLRRLTLAAAIAAFRLFATLLIILLIFAFDIFISFQPLILFTPHYCITLSLFSFDTPLPPF